MLRAAIELRSVPAAYRATVLLPTSQVVTTVPVHHKACPGLVVVWDCWAILGTYKIGWLPWLPAALSVPNALNPWLVRRRVVVLTASPQATKKLNMCPLSKGRLGSFQFLVQRLETLLEGGRHGLPLL